MSQKKHPFVTTLNYFQSAPLVEAIAAWAAVRDILRQRQMAEQEMTPAPKKPAKRRARPRKASPAETVTDGLGHPLTLPRMKASE